MNTYRIQRGDTIDRVTKALGLTWDEFRTLNPAAVGRSRKTGQWVVKAGAVVKGSASFRTVLEEKRAARETAVRSAGSEVQSGYREYTVREGDTLWGLARRYPGSTAEQIARENGISNPDRIHPGQKVRLKMGEAGESASPEPGERSEVVASWYGKEYHGRPMANGKTYNMYANTIAHRTLPFGTRVELTNPETGQIVRAVVTDRGPLIDGRDVDLSYGIAKKLSMVEKGVGKVIMEIL
ncbi:MAG: RlpA-like protein precursor [Syntrophaceae bacterium PtaB.Bin038]|nr:MAG: RlpA-like protein precursor [Syntrophaceae bacterium PtaB.Bin038]